MKLPAAILFSVGLLGACALVLYTLGLHVTWLMVAATSLWVAIDSYRLGLSRYKSGISYNPAILFMACLLLWIVGFPWYLVMRHKIKSGTAVLKLPTAPVPAAASAPTPS